MCYHYTNTGYFAPAFFWTPVLLVFPSRQRKKKRYMNFAEMIAYHLPVASLHTAPHFTRLRVRSWPKPTADLPRSERRNL